MPAFVVSEVYRIVSEEAARPPSPLARSSVLAHGGRYLLQTGDVLALEGPWDEGQRIVVMEFPTSRRARGWYDSPEYAEARAMVPGRVRAATADHPRARVADARRQMGDSAGRLRDAPMAPAPPRLADDRAATWRRRVMEMLCIVRFGSPSQGREQAAMAFAARQERSATA